MCVVYRSLLSEGVLGQFSRRLAVWLSGNALVSLNVVTLRWARLVPGWVTVFGRVNYLGMQPVIQVNSAWPSLCE